MGRSKTYSGDYESKLSRVMDRFGATDVDYNWDRHGCWVQFRLKGELYRFDHSIEKAKAHGVDIVYGSDAFAQVVLALEDLARIAERGIYELSTWVTGMKYLPPVVEVPTFFRQMGFTEIPAGAEDVRDRYRTLAKQLHPDAGGTTDAFKALQRASEQAMKWFDENGTT